MSIALPPADMLETPPGYPFEEINYDNIEVEEVGRIFIFFPTIFLLHKKALNPVWLCSYLNSILNGLI